MRASGKFVVLSCCVLSAASASAMAAAHLYTVPATIQASPGETIFFEVWTDDTNGVPVYAWQVWFDCAAVGPDGAGSGTIQYVLRPKPCEFWYDCCSVPGCDECIDGFCGTTLAGPTVDDDRADYIFFDFQHLPPTKHAGDCDAEPYDPFTDGPRAGNVSNNPWGSEPIPPQPAYLCTWAFHVSNDACGTFTLDWYCDANDHCSVDRTALLTSDGGVENYPITPLVSDPLVVVVADCGPSCPSGVVSFVNPPDGVVDARQPHPVLDTNPPQGIDTFYVWGPAGASADCWSVCEVGRPAPEITDIAEDRPGQYTVVLDRPITAGSVTTLTYNGGDGTASTGTFISHPANANGDLAADHQDITALIDLLTGETTLPWGMYSCDSNHDSDCGTQDILRLIDLLNGAGEFDPWNGTPLPTNDGSCP